MTHNKRAAGKAALAATRARALALIFSGSTMNGKRFVRNFPIVPEIWLKFF